VIVLDTHSLIWWMQGSDRLSRAARRAIQRSDDLIVPAICTWEMAMLVYRDRVRITRPLADTLAELFAEPGIRLYPLSVEVGIRAAQLSVGTPMDPADQLVAATAMVLAAPLVTSDVRLQQFPGLETVW